MRATLRIAVGDRFGCLAVIEVGLRSGSRLRRESMCRCDCGREYSVRNSSLHSSRTCRCGLARAAAGKKRPTAYESWQSMKQRCGNPRSKNFALYGGRGITVCERWLSFEGFLADMGHAPEGMSLDRIDSNGNYEPGNCRWATRAQQSRNTRAVRMTPDLAHEIRFGRFKDRPQKALARELGFSSATVHNVRHGYSWAPEAA